MPQIIEGREVATEAELLAALLPSVRERSDSCLIANALNFSCRVEPYQEAWCPRWQYFPSGDVMWVMVLPENMALDRAQALAEAVGCQLVTHHFTAPLAILLPRTIGNAADAFDLGEAFQEYAV